MVLQWKTGQMSTSGPSALTAVAAVQVVLSRGFCSKPGYYHMTLEKEIWQFTSVVVSFLLLWKNHQIGRKGFLLLFCVCVQ